MLDEINSWFNNGSAYTTGVSLYNQYGSDRLLKIVLSKGETAINRQKLSAALADLRDNADIPPPAPAPLPAKLPNTDSGKNGSSGNSGYSENSGTKPELPALLQVTKLRDQSFAEIRALQPHLFILDEGVDLHAVAKRLVQLGKQNAVHWDHYNFLAGGGQDEEPAVKPAAPPVMIDVNLLNERENIRKSLNRAQNRIKGVDKPHPNTLKLIEERRLELQLIDAKIKAIKEGGTR